MGDNEFFPLSELLQGDTLVAIMDGEEQYILIATAGSAPTAFIQTKEGADVPIEIVGAVIDGEIQPGQIAVHGEVAYKLLNCVPPKDRTAQLTLREIEHETQTVTAAKWP